MALQECNTTVSKNGRELIQHGTAAFPIACYFDDLGKNEVPWHWHEELEAAVITEGCAKVAAGNQKYTIHAGEGFFINSGILHGCRIADTSTCRFHSMAFHPRLIGGSIDSVFFQNYVQPLTKNHTLESLILTPSVLWQKAALHFIEQAWQTCVQEPPGFEFKVRAALSELVLLLQRNSPAPRKQPDRKALRDGERIKQMLHYIHDHFAEELNIGKIAQAAAISESECLRCFRAAIGTTPIQYLRQYRIQQAAQMLSATPLKISDISTQCGFGDLSYFTKTFREMKGCVPTEYRRQSQ